MVMDDNKCELHRHMGGSISPSTVAAIILRTHKRVITSSGSLHDVARRMVCDASDIGFAAFLKKFTILNEVSWPDWAVELSIAQICDDIKNEGIRYSEISFSIGKYVAEGRTPNAAVRLVGELFKRHAQRTGIQVGLLLSVQYHNSRENQLEYANLIDDPKIREIVCGLDLIGDENYFDVDFYKPIIDKWKAHGIHALRAHVGEMPGTGRNVAKAIKQLGITRIAHGIQASDDTLKLAADNQVCFDLALHSNMITGAWTDLESHPIKRMLNHQCCVTLNTDDPIQFNCTLDDEFELALANNLIDQSQVAQIMRNAQVASNRSA